MSHSSTPATFTWFFKDLNTNESWDSSAPFQARPFIRYQKYACRCCACWLFRLLRACLTTVSGKISHDDTPGLYCLVCTVTHTGLFANPENWTLQPNAVVGHLVSKSSRTSWVVAPVSKGEPGREEDPMVKEHAWGSDPGPRLHFRGWSYSCSSSHLYVKERY